MPDEDLARLILADVSRVHKELGAFPSRDAYLDRGNYPKSIIAEVFGSWTKMLLASGLQYSVKGKRDKQALRKEYSNHLAIEIELRKSQPQPPALYKHILCIGDIHAPFQHSDAIHFLLAVSQKYTFDKIIFIGDEIDMHAISFHDTDPDLLSPGHELESAIVALDPLYKRFPEASIIESNHGSLVYRKAKHHGLPRQVLKSYQEVLRAPAGWTWHPELTLQLNNGRKCLFHHGYSSNTILSSQKRAMNLVCGHFHSKFGIQYWSNAENVYFAAQTGCLVDDVSLAMAYNKSNIERPLMGSIRIENGIPHMLPMLLDNHNRWTGIVP